MSVEVDFVLVRPRRPGNVAAASRALKNMGFRSLWLVGQEGGAPWQEEARALAYGAWDVLDSARQVEELMAALRGATHVVGTTGRGSIEAQTPRQLAALASRGTLGSRVALVFGPETGGLTNSELAICHTLVHIPTDGAHSSLNLAQAVLVLAYELHLLLHPPEMPVRERGDVPVATAGAVEDALDDLRGSLLAIGYLNPQNPEQILAELRALLVRARPTARELSLVRGLARQMCWVATQKGAHDD
jgi:TrmH family RNA methyltransferase